MPVLFRRAKENSRRATDLTENGETKKIESPWYLERRYRRAGCPACTARVSCFSHRANHSPLRFPSLPALLPLLPLLSSPWRSPYTPVSSSPATANALAEKARLFYTPPLAPFHTLLLPSPPRFYSPDDRPFRSFNLFQPRPPPPPPPPCFRRTALPAATSTRGLWTPNMMRLFLSFYVPRPCSISPSFLPFSRPTASTSSRRKLVLLSRMGEGKRTASGNHQEEYPREYPRDSTRRAFLICARFHARGPSAYGG